jgi:hypothetical protein
LGTLSILDEAGLAGLFVLMSVIAELPSDMVLRKYGSVADDGAKGK